jgi:transposase-like protein
MDKVYLVRGVTEDGREDVLGVFLNERNAQKEATKIYLSTFEYDRVFASSMDILDLGD